MVSPLLRRFLVSFIQTPRPHSFFWIAARRQNFNHTIPPAAQAINLQSAVCGLQSANVIQRQIAAHTITVTSCEFEKKQIRYDVRAVSM